MTTRETRETAFAGSHSATVELEPLAAPPPKENGGRSSIALRAMVIAAVVVALGLVIYFGIRSRVQAEDALVRATKASETPVVDVVYPTVGSAAQEIALPGNTQAFIDTPIYARTSGYLKRWYTDIGAHVRQGQLLAEIETPELDEQLGQARADLKNAQANLQLAEITAARWQHLLKTNSVSKQETDQAVSDLSSKQAMVASNQANVRRLQQLQSYEHVYAPFDGVITARNTDIGALIQAGDNSIPKELFHLASTRTLRVYIAVPEVYSSAVHNGEKAQLTLDSLPGQTYTGTVVRNSDAIDPASRTLNVEVDVENPTGRLMPGAYAFVHLHVPANAGSVTIPANTLLFRSEGLRVGVVRNGHVQLTPITIGHDYGSSVEVVAGLAPHDAIIVDPSDSLENGSAVQVEVAQRRSGQTP
ncbi:MAG TPA: efflux RND transporter periplasmic adaptor subunit [Acidobacteriaceae bacterium]|nr:efflux RND transporter periplasmic adaptor subunit [Acidobacteriaceae bacterium]